MRKEGMLFSLDAIVCLVLVIVLTGAIVQEMSVEEKANPLEDLHDKAYDRAVVGAYAGGSSAETIGASAEFGECATVYVLDPDNSLNMPAMPNAETFCEEIS